MTKIEEVFRAVYTEIEGLTPTVYDYFGFRRWELDTPLEEANAKDLVRAFRVSLGDVTGGVSNSNRDTKYYRAPLLIKVGYPESLIDPNDQHKLGVEGMVASDIPLIVTRILYQRAQWAEPLGNVRVLKPWRHTRQRKTATFSFDLEWGETTGA